MDPNTDRPPSPPAAPRTIVHIALKPKMLQRVDSLVQTDCMDRSEAFRLALATGLDVIEERRRRAGGLP
jgi:metal-responsive CopG/Arc/MetJ family transcriptional regulator